MFSRFNKGLMIVMVLIALSAVIYAFAASNTMTSINPIASSGGVAVTGYTIKPDSDTWVSNGLLMTSVSFRLSSTTNEAPVAVAISTTATGSENFGSWSCSTPVYATSSSYEWITTCTATNVTVASVVRLDIVAHN